MSMMYCHKHDKHYDTDYDTTCPVCDNEFDDYGDRSIIEDEKRTERIEEHLYPSEGKY